jgi:zinc/manganese transport system permease protein
MKNTQSIMPPVTNMTKAAAMSIDAILLAPFDYAFMKRALAACVLLSLSGTPLGFFMILRRMALVGDAMTHAILPGVAIAFMISGLALGPLTLGGLAAGVVVALFATFLSRFTQLKEDASFTLIYLLSLTTGVVILSLKGNGIDLLHMLFGNILAIDGDALRLVAGTCCTTLLTLAVFYRSLVIECFDPDFLKAAKRGGWMNTVFFVLLVINLVAAFQALGTLMALGLMLLPSIGAQFWARNLDRAIPLAVIFALTSSYIGLLLSYHCNIPAGPAVVLVAGILALFSALIGRFGSVRAYIMDQA